MQLLRAGISILLLIVATGTARADIVEDLGDIEFWVGTGSNEAGLVIDWNDGRDPWVWGYRWDGVKSGFEMLTDVIRADPRLFAKVAAFGFGDALIGLGVDRDEDGFALSDGTVFPSDGYLYPGETSDGAVSLDSDDSYGEGWETGFWGYWVASDNPYAEGGAWTEPQIGAADRTLTDGSWDGWQLAPGFLSTPPLQGMAAPANVPEPSTSILFAGSMLAAGAFGRIRKRLRAQ